MHYVSYIMQRIRQVMLHCFVEDLIVQNQQQRVSGFASK